MKHIFICYLYNTILVDNFFLKVWSDFTLLDFSKKKPYSLEQMEYMYYFSKIA
jgi:hypothetical protein